MKRAIKIEGDIARIPLTQGYEAIIDAADVDLIGRWSWSAFVKRRQNGEISNVYATRSKEIDFGKNQTVFMHRVIAQTEQGFVTDHIDGNGLNNRRSNLRPATRSQNSHNQKRNVRNTSGEKGVSLCKRTSRWKARLKLHGRNHCLGYYHSLEEAANAVRAARIKMHGNFANHGD